MGFRRIAALAISAVMLLTPVMAPAESYGFSAGDLTKETLAESFSGGYQVNASFGFDIDENALAAYGKPATAAASLLEKAAVVLSFYDDFGTTRIRANVTLDGVELMTGDMLVYEDGSVQLVTSLTGNMAFTLPAGTVTADGIALPGSDAQWTDENADQVHPFTRLKQTSADMTSTLINLLLGWVSGTHMETGELYTFDYETYIDATETRDAVATRMIGKIQGNDLHRFLWNVVSHIRDREHDFQSALAYSIAEFGVTRYQARAFTDALFPNDAVDHDAFHLTPSSEIPDDGSPIQYGDVLYFLCKLEANMMEAWGNTYNDVSSMIVSYDDFGETVGFDAELRRFAGAYPYEGNFTYSKRTDDDWQRHHIAHGELQLFDGERLIGDMSMQQGEDVGGVKASYLNGQLDLVDQATGDSMGIGLLSSLDFVLSQDGMTETIEGGVNVLLNLTGSSQPLMEAKVDAVSTLTDTGLALTGKIAASAFGENVAAVNVSVECVDYVDEPFAGGQAVDLSREMTEEQIQAIEDTVKGKAVGLAAKLALKPAVLGDLLELTALLGE